MFWYVDNIMDRTPEVDAPWIARASIWLQHKYDMDSGTNVDLAHYRETSDSGAGAPSVITARETNIVDAWKYRIAINMCVSVRDGRLYMYVRVLVCVNVSN